MLRVWAVDSADVNTISEPIGSGIQDALHKIMTLHKVSVYQRTWRSSGVALMFCIGRSGVQDSGPENDYPNGLFIIFSSVSRVNADVSTSKLAYDRLLLHLFR